MIHSLKVNLAFMVKLKRWNVVQKGLTVQVVGKKKKKQRKKKKIKLKNVGLIPFMLESA